MEVPTRIEVEGGRLVVLTWDDGDRQELTASELRSACPCAACREVRTAPAPDTRIAEAKLVGDYAINFVFEPDNHYQGIFSFDLLRALEGS